MGVNDKLSLHDLSYKVVMLLALTRPSRSADLVGLDLRFRRYLPEGVSFFFAYNVGQSHGRLLLSSLPSQCQPVSGRDTPGI